MTSGKVYHGCIEPCCGDLSDLANSMTLFRVIWAHRKAVSCSNYSNALPFSVLNSFSFAVLDMDSKLISDLGEGSLFSEIIKVNITPVSASKLPIMKVFVKLSHPLSRDVVRKLAASGGRGSDTRRGIISDQPPVGINVLFVDHGNRSSFTAP